MAESMKCKNNPSAIPNSSRMMSQACPKHVPNMSQTRPKHVQNMSKTCPKHVQNMSNTCPKHVQNMSKSYPNHVQNMSNTCPKHVQSMANTCLEHVQHMPNTWPTHCQHMSNSSHWTRNTSKTDGNIFKNSYFQCGTYIGGSCCWTRTDITKIGNVRQHGTTCDTNIQQYMIQKACLCMGFHSISYSTCIRLNN